MRKRSKEEVIDDLITDEDVEEEESLGEEEPPEEKELLEEGPPDKVVKGYRKRFAGTISPITYPEAARILETPEYFSDIANFKGISANDLSEMISEGLIDPNGRQNDSPTARQFSEFMQQHSGVTAHGYVTAPTRDDYRVTIEGLEYSGSIDERLAKDFTDFAEGANEFDLDDNKFRCWWD